MDALLQMGREDVVEESLKKFFDPIGKIFLAFCWGKSAYKDCRFYSTQQRFPPVRKGFGVWCLKKKNA